MGTLAWGWLGEHPAVDLANTVRRRGFVLTELLDTPPALAGWLDAERERLPVPARVDQRLLDAFRSLRDHTLRLCHAAVAGAELPPASVAAVNEIVLRTPLPRLLTDRAGRSVSGQARTADPWEDLLAALAAAVVDLLGAPDLHHLAFCDAPGCGQFFHRGRPNQTWCGPACGDRARAARYHRRTGR